MLPARLQRLIDEFNTELTAIGTRVDDLEGRTAFLLAFRLKRSDSAKLSGAQTYY